MLFSMCVYSICHSACVSFGLLTGKVLSSVRICYTVSLTLNLVYVCVCANTDMVPVFAFMFVCVCCYPENTTTTKKFSLDPQSLV